jgi:hypothetical protein
LEPGTDKAFWLKNVGTQYYGNSKVQLEREILNVNLQYWSFNSGTDFFVSERVDLPASWCCLLQSSVLVLVHTYSIIPATHKSISGSHFL